MKKNKYNPIDESCTYNLPMVPCGIKFPKIYDEETATGTYYNEPTIAGVNVRYCTDKDWATKIFKYMDQLYSRL